MAFLSFVAFEAVSRLVSERSVWGLQGAPVTPLWWLHAPLDAW